MQRPGSRQMRRPGQAVAAAAVLLAAVTVVACLPGAVADYNDKSDWPPVVDAPSDGCMSIAHKVPVKDGFDYAGVCANFGQVFVNMTLRFGPWKFRSDQQKAMEVVCSRCGLNNYKLIRAGYGVTDCPPGWLQLAEATFVTSPDGTVTAYGFLCAAYRPACLNCQYTWRGEAPFCDGYCQEGETLLGRSDYGDGEECWTGTKDLCEQCPGGSPYDLESRQCQNTCATECNVLGQTLYNLGNIGGQCPDQMWCMACPAKPADQMCSDGDSGKAKCGGQATGIRWTDKPSTTAKRVKSGAACCTACLRNARCRRYQFSAAAGVGCQLFYSKAPANKRLTKKARGYVRGQKMGQ